MLWIWSSCLPFPAHYLFLFHTGIGVSVFTEAQKMKYFPNCRTISVTGQGGTVWAFGDWTSDVPPGSFHASWTGLPAASRLCEWVWSVEQGRSWMACWLTDEVEVGGGWKLRLAGLETIETGWPSFHSSTSSFQCSIVTQWFSPSSPKLCSTKRAYRACPDLVLCCILL